MSYKKVAIGVVLSLATIAFPVVAETPSKRGLQQRQLDVETTQGIDRRRDPLGVSDTAPGRDMKMITVPRGGRLEMILVPADPTS